MEVLWRPIILSLWKCPSLGFCVYPCLFYRKLPQCIASFWILYLDMFLCVTCLSWLWKLYGCSFASLGSKCPPVLKVSRSGSGGVSLGYNFNLV